MCRGEDEEEFIHHLTEAIWEANGVFCQVSVEATYLEAAPPVAEYSLDRDDYDRWRRASERDGVDQELAQTDESDESLIDPSGEALLTLDYAIAHPMELDRKFAPIGEGEFEAGILHLGQTITIWRYDDDDESTFGWVGAGKQNGEVLDSLEECLDDCRIALGDDLRPTCPWHGGDSQHESPTKTILSAGKALAEHSREG